MSYPTIGQSSALPPSWPRPPLQTLPPPLPLNAGVQWSSDSAAVLPSPPSWSLFPPQYSAMPSPPLPTPSSVLPPSWTLPSALPSPPLQAPPAPPPQKTGVQWSSDSASVQISELPSEIQVSICGQNDSVVYRRSNAANPPPLYSAGTQAANYFATQSSTLTQRRLPAKEKSTIATQTTKNSEYVYEDHRDDICFKILLVPLFGVIFLWVLLFIFGIYVYFLGVLY